MPDKLKIRFKRLMIYTNGATMMLTQGAENLSDVLEQELEHSVQRGKVIVQINIKEDD